MINHVKASLLIAENNYKAATSEQWNLVAEKLYMIQKQASELDLHARLLKKELITLSKEKSTCGAEYYFQEIISKGSVDYEAIPELKNIDLDKYRKKNRVSWKLNKY